MNYVMDNFSFDVVCRGEQPFTLAMQLAFGESKAIAYLVDPGKGLVFLWAVDRDGIPLPFKMDPLSAAHFAWRWLAETEFPRQPDHDGDNCKGWRIYNDAWGHVGSHRYAIIAVQPVWAILGK
jgi:hypothetical protein